MMEWYNSSYNTGGLHPCTGGYGIVISNNGVKLLFSHYEVIVEKQYSFSSSPEDGGSTEPL